MASMSSTIAINAHLLSGEASYRSAGIHSYIYHTLIHLPEAAPEFGFTVYTGLGTVPDNGRIAVRRSLIPTKTPANRIVWEQLFAPPHLLTTRPALYHGMGFSLPFLWPGRSVVTIYDMSFMRYPERTTRARRAYLNAIVPPSVRRASRVLTISESSKREIVELLDVDPDRIDIAVPGVNKQFKPCDPLDVAAFREEQSLPDHFILYVGTIEPRKNLTTLIRAYAELPEKDEIPLVIAGGAGWGSDEVYRLIEALGLTNHILLPGYVSNDRLPLWYNAADVFVYPSLYEGFGLPIVEAMACATPVIASNSTSLPEAAGDAALLVPPLDVAAWRDALHSLLNDADQQDDLARRGRKHAGQFDWSRTAQQTADSYRRALSED